MDFDDNKDDQKTTNNTEENIVDSKNFITSKKTTPKCDNNIEEDNTSMEANFRNELNVEKNINRQSNQRNEEENYVESEFTKKYGYLVPSNDSIYGVNSYCQDYSGYKGYFDYSASQYVTTPCNLYKATFASEENANDAIITNDNTSSNTGNDYNKEYVNLLNDDQNITENNLDGNYMSQETINDKNSHVLNHLSINVNNETEYSVVTENTSKNETKKRHHSSETNEYEPLQKKKDIDDKKKKINDHSCYNGVILLNETSINNDTKNLIENNDDGNKKINKKNVSSDMKKNKEKPLDIGGKLSQEMDISSILGTNISMGVSTLKPKIIEQVANKDNNKKTALNLRSTKNVVSKPKLEITVAKETKSNHDVKSDIQFCDEKKTLIKVVGSKVGIIDRKKMFNQLFNALKQQQVLEVEAKELATKKEHKCIIEGIDSSKYKSKCYNEIMKIKKRDCSPFVDKNVKKLEFSTKDINQFHKYLKDFVLSKEDLVKNEFPMWDLNNPDECICYEQGRSLSNKTSYAPVGENRRICCRCSKTFEINNTTFEPTKKDVTCIYHSGKLLLDCFQYEKCDKTFNCCGGLSDSMGCKEGDEHVTITEPYTNLKLFKEFPFTKEDTSDKAVYSLDCEMILTIAGQEVARVTVIDMNCQIVYDQLIKPKYRVTDYCTQYSGITEELLKTNVITLEEAQEKLFEFINQDTILVGHSINCDLKALRLIHKNIVDTSVIFPHKNPQYKNSLKRLAKHYLKMDIQESQTGHDSAEDAIAVMKLLISKFKGKI